MKLRTALIGLIVIFLAGYILGYAYPPTYFLPNSENLDTVDKELSKSMEYIYRMINLTEQGKYDEAMGMLNKSEKSSDAVGEYIASYEKEKNYLDKLISCMKNLVYIVERSQTNKTEETVKYIDKFLSDFSELEDISSDIEKYPVIAERLNIEKIMINLNSIKYDAMDFKKEIKQNITPSPITTKGYIKEFYWKDHLGKERILTTKISERRLDRYKNSPHAVYGNYQDFVTYNDSQIKEEIANWFNDTYQDREDKANCILTFVQNIQYVSEPEGEDYWKYPIETMIEGGDCEDKAILFVAIAKAVGYDTALILLEDHRIAGVVLEGPLKRTESSVYYPEGGKRYYVCETTKRGLHVGDILDKYRGKRGSVEIIG